MQKREPLFFYQDSQFKRQRNTGPSIIAVVGNYADLYA